MSDAPSPTAARGAAPPADHPDYLTLGQIAEEINSCLRTGREPDVEALAARHPALAAPIREMAGALVMLNQFGPGAESGPLSAPRIADMAPVLGQLGDFQLVREVGRGGMGVVYEAVQLTLDRRVALKILPLAGALDAKQLQRFKNEARAAAHLHHTNIVPVFGIGCERGVHYYAMQFIEGQTLAALIQELRDGQRETGRQGDKETKNALNPTAEQRSHSFFLSPCLHVSVSAVHRSTFFRAVAQLGIQAAEALEHAHQSGVIHRDIKPANLLIDWRAGGVNPLKLWVTDFGLARLQGDAGLTMSGDLLGTLRYMSPEQAQGKGAIVDPRTDIYSLGATLYELVSLRPAFDGRDRPEVLRQIAEQEPPTLRSQNKAVPAELATIILKAMSKSADERYATAQELADDLRRFLEDKPIRARQPSLRQRALKWARRHKAVVRAALVVVVLAVAALVVSTVVIWRAKGDADRANAGLTLALERERLTLYYQRIALAEREWTANNLNRYDQLLDECPDNLRGWEWHYLKRLRYQAVATLRHDAAVLCTAISPDGRRIASGSQVGILTFWDARTGRNLTSFVAHEDHVRAVAFSPDGQRLATVSWDKAVKIWDAKALDARGSVSPLLTLKGHTGRVNSVAFSPDGQRLVSAGAGNEPHAGEVKVWDAATGTEIRTLVGHAGTVNCTAFSPDGRRLASASSDQTVRVWNIQTGQEQLTFRGHNEVVWGVAFSPDGLHLASASGRLGAPADNEIKIWDGQTGQEVSTLRGHSLEVFCVAFSPDGRRLASGGGDQIVKMWDVTTGQEALTLHGHVNKVRTVAFSPDGRRLISASHDRTVRVWDATPGPDAKDVDALTLREHRDPVGGIAYNPADRRLLASAGWDGTIRLWDPWTGKPRHAMNAYPRNARAVAFSPDGQYLAAAGETGIVKVWGTTTWREVLDVSLPTRELPATIAFSPDGRYLATAGYDFVVTILEMPSGKRIHQLRGHKWPIHNIAYRPDGRVVASASSDGTVHLWDVTTGRNLAESPLRHTGDVLGVAFRPDGERLASAGWDRTVRIWETTTWKQCQLLHDPTGGVSSVAYSPDGRRLAWGTTDAAVKVWDEATGEIHTLRGHTSWVRSVAFSPDGKQIASASADGTVKIWDAPPAVDLSSEQVK